MNPTRLPNDKSSGSIIRTSQRLLLIAGSLLTLMGLAALTSELWRTFWGLTAFSKVRVLFALAILGLGLVLIQTLNPLKIVEGIEAFWLSRRPNGRRRTDPKVEEPCDLPPPPLLKRRRDD